MQKKYHIEGMTCQGCRSGLEQTLNSITEVINAKVSLDDKEAVITLKKELQIDTLKKIIPAKYTITEKVYDSKNFLEFDKEKVQQKTQWQQLFPLFLIFGYITIAAILLNIKTGSVDGFMLDFMGLFYIVFSFFKVLDLRGFSKSFRMYDPTAKMIPAYGWIYPFVEIGLGLLFLMRYKIDIALIMTILILGMTTIGVVQVLVNKKSIQCACLGTVLKLPMTKATWIENTIMIIMAVWMLIKIYT